MAVSRTSNTEWMLHPSLVFKAFEEPLIKSPFSYNNTPHIVPEKITESFIDQNGIRCYRVKWLDSWLTEQHVTAAFPHLITEYWISKPINEPGAEYQGYTTRALTAMSLPLQANVLSLSKNSKTNSKTQAQPAELLHHLAPQTSTTMSIPQLFNNDQSKHAQIQSQLQNSHNQQQQQQSHQQSQKHETTVVEKTSTHASNARVSEPDFVVGESLKLPEKLYIKTDDDPKMTENLSLQSDKSNDGNIILLLDKHGNNVIELPPQQQHQNMKEKEKSVFDNTKPLTNILSAAAYESQLQQYVNQIVNQSMPTIEQMHHQSLAAQMHEVISEEKKPCVSKKSVSKQPKVNLPKEKQPVVCDICGKTISSRKNLRVHKTVKHFKNGNFACDICGRKFALSRDLKRHMPLHTNERNYVCGYCGLQCKQPGHLTKHIRTHTEVMNWRCDCCFKNFRVQAELKQHCFAEHADIKDKNLNCSVCKEKLKLPNSVYLHSLRHSGVREFECHICKATFKLKQHMQVHLKTHERMKEPAKHVCDICNKEFKFKHMCEKHREKHAEATAEEYQENQKNKEELKRIKVTKRIGKYKKIDHLATSGNVHEKDSAESQGSDTENSLPKRKRRRPTKVFYDEDLHTKKLVRKKFDKNNFSCTECDNSFRSKPLLNSHIKLHKLEQASKDKDAEIIDENNGVEKSAEEREFGVEHTHSYKQNDPTITEIDLDTTGSKYGGEINFALSSAPIVCDTSTSLVGVQITSESKESITTASSSVPRISMLGTSTSKMNDLHIASLSSSSSLNMNPLLEIGAITASVLSSSSLDTFSTSQLNLSTNHSNTTDSRKTISLSEASLTNSVMLPSFKSSQYATSYIPFMNVSRLASSKTEGSTISHTTFVNVTRASTKNSTESADQSKIENMALIPETGPGSLSD